MILRARVPARLSRPGLLTVLLLAATVLPVWSQSDVPASGGETIGEAAVALDSLEWEGGPPGLGGPLGAGGTTAASPHDLRAYRGRGGVTVSVSGVTGSKGGAVWGTDVFTDDSDLGTAAVHAGVLGEGETADLQVVILPGLPSYRGSARNGVTSNDYREWGGSFVFAARPQAQTAPAPRGEAPQPSDWRGRVGRTFDVELVGSASGTVWGSTVYTDDSPLAAAAVHAGVLRAGERGRVRVTVLPGRDRYDGSTRNGVTSRPWRSWSGSYFLEAAPKDTTAPAGIAADPEAAAPRSMTAYRDRVGQTFRFRVTGSAAGSVWGATVYTDDSSVAAAAVHAGALEPGETGVVDVTVLPGRESYSGSTRNGVTSNDWGSFGGSYFVEPAADRSAGPEAAEDAFFFGSSEWRLTLPKGFTYSATLEPAGPGRFRLRSRAANLNGVYELRGRRLVGVEPGTADFAGYGWRVADAGLLVLDENAARPAGSYFGATLARTPAGAAEPDILSGGPGAFFPAR